MFVGPYLFISYNECASASPTWEIVEAREDFNEQEIYIFDLNTIIIEYQEWEEHEVLCVVGGFTCVSASSTAVFTPELCLSITSHSLLGGSSWNITIIESLPVDR